MPLVPCIKSSNEVLRGEALQLLGHLIQKVNDASVLERMFQDLLKALRGSCSFVQYTYLHDRKTS